MFPNRINVNQAPGVLGDFASTNPFSSVLAGPGALVAPAGGLKVGAFCWVGPVGQISQSFVAGWQIGFLGKNAQALITQFLGESTLVVPAGFMVNLFNGGDFWAKFPAGGTVGNNVYADPNNGDAVAGATAPALGVGTGTIGAAVASGTTDGTTANWVVTTVTNGIINPGDAVTGTGVAAGTTVVSQTSGTPGKAGTYVLSSVPTAQAAIAYTVTSSKLLITAMTSGDFDIGDPIGGTGVAAGATILSQALPFNGEANIVTGSLSTLVVTSVVPGTDLLRVGAKVVAPNVTAGTTISAQVSGTPGGVGSYTLSAAGTVGVSVTTTTADSAGGTGLYTVSGGNQTAGTASAPTTITVPGTAQATGFKLRGSYSPLANEIGKISTL